MFSFSKKRFISHCPIFSSKLSPPNCVSPEVANTSNTSSPTSRIETSNVPPPKSKTRIVSLSHLSKPNDIAAAVGSLIIRITSKPAIFPASLVAWCCVNH